MRIKPVSVWHDGASKKADELDIRIVNDDLKSNAVFYYELRAEGVQVASGNVSFSGEEYDSWNSASDVNGEAIKKVVEKLNLELDEVS